ncbi:rod shape-determining protein RodA [Qipengyuania gaetbuli]|uniref:rod shape-determining protein RodA n=1 Tax=Qipengyuania gaetbuli TaxID=266952 RepID=UPI001C99B502|nr:rod shape-determining protein RodA [Qipengyuania gaetbuli]MBY6013595.1 rod shape-determining protein RodA [Qipengyuania gaetbuli]
MTSIVPAPVARQPWMMLFPLVGLIAFGALVLTSAAAGDFSRYAESHLIRFAIFLTMAIVISRFSKDLVTFFAYPSYIVILLLLMAVEIMGTLGGGSQRWLEVGPIRIQPSELMKPAVVVALARFYDTLPVGMVPTWRALIPAGALIMFPMAFVLLQPDLGTSLAIGFGGGLVMFFAGLPLRWFLMAGAAGLAAIPFAFFFALKPYQQDRVTTFLDPESDPLGEGYQITQSKIAIGSGGLSGKGFNEGSQSHLNYLPEPHTDFVFATMAEEWGLMGGLFVIGCFALILGWGFKVARDSTDRMGKLLAAGMTATIFFFVAINLMMVMGFAPVVGIPLPFVSHGGSSMMTNMMCIGVLMMVNRWNRNAPRRGLLS